MSTCFEHYADQGRGLKTSTRYSPVRGKGNSLYLSQFVSILGNLYPDRGVKVPFWGMFRKMDLCKKILIQAYTSLI